MASMDSAIVEVAGPKLLGVWLLDPDDPLGTEHQFLYAPAGKTEKREVQSELLIFAGRTLPVAEFGENESHTLRVSLVIPWEMTWWSDWQTVKDFYTLHKTYLYRDGRGRSWYGVLRGMEFEDVREGTEVSFTFERVDYDATPASLAMFTSQSEE